MQRRDLTLVSSAARVNRIRVGTSRLPGEDGEIDLHFVLHLDHATANADGPDSESGLLEGGVGGVGVAGSLHGQGDGLRDAVQGQIALDLPPVGIFAVSTVNSTWGAGDSPMAPEEMGAEIV